MITPQPDWLPFFKLPEWEETHQETPDPYGVFAEGASQRRAQENENQEYAFAARIIDWTQLAEDSSNSSTARLNAVLLTVRAALLLCVGVSEQRQAQLSRILEHLLIMLYSNVLRVAKSPINLSSSSSLREDRDQMALRLINDWSTEFAQLPSEPIDKLVTDLGDVLALTVSKLPPADAYCILVGVINSPEFPPSYAELPTKLACAAILKMENGQANYIVSVLSLLMSIIRRCKPADSEWSENAPFKPVAKPWPMDGLGLLMAFCDGMGPNLYITPKDDVHSVSRNSIYSAIGRVIHLNSDFALVDERTESLTFSSDEKMNESIMKSLLSLIAILLRVQTHSSIIELAASINILSPQTDSISDMELNALASARVFAICLLALHYGGHRFPSPQPICLALSPGTIFSALWKPVTCLATHALSMEEGRDSSQYLAMLTAQVMWHYVPELEDVAFRTEHGFHVPLPQCLTKYVQVLALWARGCFPTDRLRLANVDGLRAFMSRFEPKPAASILTQVLHSVLLSEEGVEVLKPSSGAFLLKLIRNIPNYDQLSTVETARKEILDFVEEDAILSTWAKVIHELANVINLSAVFKERSRKPLEDLRNRIETVLRVDNDEDLRLASAAIELAIE